ncbi:hypothetical protein NP493_103g00009 [Ridgeia piscesae]|uniref:Uncharacterized protein n=1 Tax=Ridgeia piscesae TaxID=27915 RepID=A0AAD9P7E8_RIDPI|nr:hypothetical protein NP493_103g00009 [Ridgeia piscesae]
MHCDDMQDTTCKSMPQLMPDMMMVYKGCTHNSGSVQVTLHCCVPGIGSSEGAGGTPPQPLLCEVKGDSQAVTTPTQTVKSPTSTQPAAPGSHSLSREEESDSMSGVTIGLIAGLAGAIVFAVIVILVMFRLCRHKRLVTEDVEKTIPAGFGPKSIHYGDIGDDGYMDIKALDKEKEKPQVN